MSYTSLGGRVSEYVRPSDLEGLSDVEQQPEVGASEATKQAAPTGSFFGFSAKQVSSFKPSFTCPEWMKTGVKDFFSSVGNAANKMKNPFSGFSIKLTLPSNPFASKTPVALLKSANDLLQKTTGNTNVEHAHQELKDTVDRLALALDTTKARIGSHYGDVLRSATREVTQAQKNLENAIKNPTRSPSDASSFAKIPTANIMDIA